MCSVFVRVKETGQVEDKKKKKWQALKTTEDEQYLKGMSLRNAGKDIHQKSDTGLEKCCCSLRPHLQ